VYRSGGDVLHKLNLLQPHFVVVGSGCWNDIDTIAGACAPVQPLIIMRDMSDNLIDQSPEQVMDQMATVAAQKFYKRIAFHLLNESYSNVEKARDWELRAIKHAHACKFPTVALNLAYGNDPPLQYKEVAEASKYIGPHLYDGWEEDKNKWVDRIYTSRRYAGNWMADFTHKMIATEVGIESFPSPGYPRGWRDMGLSEEVVKNRMLANSLHWKQDGLLGVCWFTLAD
jgi:hypothetical protein